MTMLNKLKFEAIEDNSGGLHLFIFEDASGNGNDQIIYEHSGYEYNLGQLTDDIASLLSGGHPDNWEGCEDNPQSDYDYVTNNQYGFNIVASCNYHGVYEIDINAMGLSALREFNIDNS